MARGKSKKAAKALTPEEKLEQALVPAEEQPHPAPENWCWVYLTTGFAECLDSFRKPVNAAERARRSGDIPYYGATGQVGWIDDFLTNEQLVLVGEDGAPFLDLIKDKAYIIEGKAWVNNHVHILRSHYGSVGNFYLLHYLNCFDYTGYVNGTTRLKLTQASMNTIPIPFPPLPEQHRIVDRIESIFAKLDEAKEKAQSVVNGFELRKSAILHKALMGDLTERWRQAHDVTLDSWQDMPLGKCLLPMKTRKPTGSYFRYIDIDAIDNKRQEVGEPKIIETAKAPSRASRAVEAGNVLFSMVRPYLKNIALVDETMNDCIASTGFYVCRCKSNILPKYLYELLCSKDALDYLMQFMKGDNSPSIRKDDLLNMEIKLPSIAEQKALCEIIGGILAKEQQAKEAAESVIAQIDTIKKAVLSRAFRGELGTNDPAEESAAELLKAVL